MSRRSRRYLLFLGAAIGLVLLGTIVLAAAGLHDHLGRSDVALVLGSKVQLDGTPSPRLCARLDRTLELYREGYFPSVIVSGATGREGYDEALVMRDYLVSHGIPVDHVIVDSGGTTTFASARNAIQIARAHRFESILVVSQYFHLPRARLALQRFGVLTVYSAHARIFELRDIYSSPRELIGYVSYLFRRYDSAAMKVPAQAAHRTAIASDSLHEGLPSTFRGVNNFSGLAVAEFCLVRS
jgi:vancomycin permeability regulator SanA